MVDKYHPFTRWRTRRENADEIIARGTFGREFVRFKIRFVFEINDEQRERTALIHLLSSVLVPFRQRGDEREKWLESWDLLLCGYTAGAEPRTCVDAFK